MQRFFVFLFCLIPVVAFGATCDAGYYLNANDECTICEPGYYCRDDIRSKCNANNYSDTYGATVCTTCPFATRYKEYVHGYSNWQGDNVLHTRREGCMTTISLSSPIPNGTLTKVVCWYSSEDNDYCVKDADWARNRQAEVWFSCNPGHYFPRNLGGGNQYYVYKKLITDQNKTLLESILDDIECVPVTPGYYSSPTNNKLRVQCPNGQITGIQTATSVDECGRVMHIGDENLLYLRGAQRTHPALAVQIGEKTFYGDMTTDKCGVLRTELNGQKYSICNKDIDM